MTSRAAIACTRPTTPRRGREVMKLVCLKCKRLGSRFVGGVYLCKFHARLAEMIAKSGKG